MAKTKTKPPTDRPLQVTRRENEPDAAAFARTVIRPSLQAATVIKDYSKAFGELELLGVMDELIEQVEQVNKGDLYRAEAMLITQAYALNAMFSCLARRGASNMDEYLNAAERFIRLALKAQAQCAHTLEVLAAIKNPPAVFARQANITNGPQQINNGVAHAEKIKNSPNELLEVDHGKRLDIATKATPSRVDPHLETVEAIDRPPNARRQGTG